MRTEQTPAGPVDHRRLFLGSELPATGVSKSWWTKVRGRGPDMVLSWGSAHPTPKKTVPGSPNDAGEKLGAPELQACLARSGVERGLQAWIPGAVLSGSQEGIWGGARGGVLG